jgi:cation:H+ antiporter
MGIHPVVVGLTVVAFGTSAPELAISIQSAWSGQADIAVGNIVGSNISNILLILGISAIIAPLAVAQQLVRFDVPIMVGASILTAILTWNGVLTRLEGLFLLALMATYLVFVVRQSRLSTKAVEAEYDEGYAKPPYSGRRDIVIRISLLIAGLIVMVLGARWLVDSASSMARALGVSELVIGLTIVAIGTSAPELATSIIATLRGQRDIAVGNVIGSNIFNLLFVLATTAVVAPDNIQIPPAALAFDIPFMVAVSIACLPIFFTRYTIRRWEGILFLGYYIADIIYLYLRSTQHSALPRFNTIMFLFVVPLTVLGLALSLILELRQRRMDAVAPASIEND